MAFKLRRPPLLVYDNGPIYTARCYSHAHGGRRQMDGGGLLSTFPTTTKGIPASTAMMDQSTSATATSTAKKANSTLGGQTPQPLHVNFGPPDVIPAVVERKKKFLTAKYGTHQMSLIKKRLGVEMWMYDEIQYLFGTDSSDDCEVELDLDELLDIDDENGRKNWLKEKLINAKQSQEAVKKFIDELVSRAKTL